MEKSENLGMCTFDQALFRLFEQGRITEDEALRNADSANNLRLKISLSRGNAQQIVDNTRLTILPDSDDHQSNMQFNRSGQADKKR